MSDKPLDIEEWNKRLSEMMNDPEFQARMRQVERELDAGLGVRYKVTERGLRRMPRKEPLTVTVDRVIKAFPDEVACYPDEPQVLGFLLGKVMQATDGKADAALVQMLLKTVLEQ